MKQVILDTNAIDVLSSQFPDLKTKAESKGFNLVVMDIQLSQIHNIPENKNPGIKASLIALVNSLHTASAIGIIPGLSKLGWSSPAPENKMLEFLGKKADNERNRADAVIALTTLNSDSILITNDNGLRAAVIRHGGKVFTPESFNTLLDSLDNEL